MFPASPLILSDDDEDVFRVSLQFLSGRLGKQETLEWALRLNEREHAKRLALLRLIEGPEGQELAEPWRSAWRLIEEGWKSAHAGEDSASRGYLVRRRLRSGDRSGTMVEMIVALVAPRLKVEPLSKLRLYLARPPKKPRNPQDILLARLVSGRYPERDAIDLGRVSEVPFLTSLATAVEAAVERGLNIARRIGWERGLARLGQLHRVYYVRAQDRAPGQDEPDRFHEGIAPSVKLLSSVVERLAELDVSAALRFIQRWRQSDSLIHLRVWAAMARNPMLVSADEVGRFLKTLDDVAFWDLHLYPEIAELRALRFGELATELQVALIARIRKRPPKKIWRGRSDRGEINEARLYWAARELRRLEIGGFNLPPQDSSWLHEQTARFSDLASMVRVDEGFLGAAGARWVGANPDERFGTLRGHQRLVALEEALTSSRGQFLDDPAERALDWLREPGNALEVLADLESVAEAGAAYAAVWNEFASALSPRGEQTEVPRNPPAEAERVLMLMAQLPIETMQQAIEGIAEWLFSWREQISGCPNALGIWLKAWPSAVKATDAIRTASSQTEPTPIARSNDGEQIDVDTLNTPVGKLVETFLAACPDLRDVGQPFSGGGLRNVREAIIATQGPSGLIARHRLIISLPYLLHADRQWTEENLLRPLREETREGLVLWQAIARRPHSSDVLKIIGPNMSERAVDRRLDRETREMLVFNLVVEGLFSLLERRDPAVAYPRIQQMLRTVEDEVRAHGADTVRRFVSEVSATEDREATFSAEELFRHAAAPFLTAVWPQERSLATSGVSRSFAGLPAASGGAFAEAVAVVERFLVPFDCWWLGEYGFYRSEEDEGRRLDDIDNREKADALLQLLALTIGTNEGAVIPDDLHVALEQVRSVAPSLVSSRNYRRLATDARRI